jgi:phosphoribosyl 1,2-cyclic phosphodiesterase
VLLTTGVRVQPKSRRVQNGAHGFLVGPRERTFAYFPAVGGFPEASLALLRAVTIDVLILDTLKPSGERDPVHFCLDQALALVRQLRPKTTYLVGLGHQV